MMDDGNLSPHQVASRLIYIENTENLSMSGLAVKREISNGYRSFMSKFRVRRSDSDSGKVSARVINKNREQVLAERLFFLRYCAENRIPVHYIGI